MPAAPRLPNLAKSPFAITENTSTDSTGVLPLSGTYSAEPKGQRSPSFVDGAPAFAERAPVFPDGPANASQPSPASLTGPLPDPEARQRSQPSTPEASQAAAAQAAQPAAQQPSHGHYRSSAQPFTSGSPLASYPPVPLPMMMGMAGGSRVEVEMQPLAQPYAPPPPLARHEASQGYEPVRPPENRPYSAPPPPLALSEPPMGELRTTGALPLVHPKRSVPPGPLASVPPGPLVNSEPPPPITTQPPPALDAFDPSGEPYPPSAGKVGDPIIVPMSSLFFAGAILIAMAVAAFFIGRSSVASRGGAGPARAAFAALPRLARVALPTPPKPCWMAKQPVRWAPGVVQSVPVDVAPTANGVVVAFARDAREPGTVEVDFSSGTFTEKPAEKREGDLVRVFAPRDGSGLLATTKSDSGPLAPYVYAPGPAPFVIGVAGRGTSSPSVVAADKPDGTPDTLWTLPSIEEDKGLEAARVLGSGPSSYAVVFRRAGSILAGYVGEGRKAQGGLSVITGSGGSVGRPAVGSNKREIAVVFGDRLNAESPWEIRVGHAALGQMPRDTMVVPLPKGGPGGDAFAPDVAGTSDGRWVLVWTEGKTGAYAVRAQTFGADFKPLGDPIAISPPAGNFGQAVVGVAGNYVTTMFLSRAGSGSYELWGAVLQCGS